MAIVASPRVGQQRGHDKPHLCTRIVSCVVMSSIMCRGHDKPHLSTLVLALAVDPILLVLP